MISKQYMLEFYLRNLVNKRSNHNAALPSYLLNFQPTDHYEN